MSRMRPALVLAIALIAPAFAGCMELVDEPADSTSPVKRSATPKTIAPRASGTMTGEQTDQAATAQLCGTVVLPPEQTYCASQVIQLAGTMDGMDELPVTLDTFVGDIDVTTTAGNKWSVLVTLEARGSSESDAIAQLENIALTWSHETGVGHTLKVLAAKKDEQSNRGEAANFQATLPSDVKYFLNCLNAVGDISVSKLKGSQIFLDSASGDLLAAEIDAQWLFADTASGTTTISQIIAEEVYVDSASGSINVQGNVGTVTADSASGDSVIDIEGSVVSVDSASGSIQVSFTPTADGSMYVNTASGSIQMALTEGPEIGYSVDASTSSGSVDIGLKDGKTSSDEDGQAKHFLTTNYGQRSIQTAIEARSTSGSVDVQPE